LKHDWIHKYLSHEDLEKIKEEIGKVEQTTSGEIKLSLRDKRRFFEKLYKPEELASRDFDKLGVANTKNKTGILIFILFGERYYNIIADEGIHVKIPEQVWTSIDSKLVGEFRKEGYLNGILHIIDRVGQVLKKEFPREADDTNEVSDEIAVQ
jgi:uncharacterized membrane protein